MASPRPRRGRGAILDASLELFTAVGYHGTSVREIAARADVTVASIYHHFASKQEILQTIMESTLADVLDATDRALRSAREAPTDRLQALVRGWILFHVERLPGALIGASEIRSLDEPGRARVVALRDQQEAVFRAVVDEGVTDGSFTTPLPREAARAIINMGRSIVTWYHPDGPSSPEELAEQYAVLALAMLEPSH